MERGEKKRGRRETGGGGDLFGKVCSIKMRSGKREGKGKKGRKTVERG